MSATTQKEGGSPKTYDVEWQNDSAAEKYHRAEAATGLYADIMMAKAGIANVTSDVHALDLGCGTGATIASIYGAVPKEKWEKLHVVGGDISESMLAYVRARAEREGWMGVSTEIVNAADMHLPASSLTHLFANAILFMLPLTTLPTCFSLLKPGGFIGMSTWTALPWYSLVQRAVAAAPSLPPLPSLSEVQDRLHKGNAWHDPSFVQAQLESAGFGDVQTVRQQVDVDVSTPAQFCETMTMPMVMVASFWPEETRKETLAVLSRELMKVAVEEAGGEEGTFTLKMDGIVGVGWKRE